MTSPLSTDFTAFHTNENIKSGLHLENLPRGGAKIGFQEIVCGGMHLATLMHSRLCHLLYNHVICIVGVSKGGEICQGGEILSRGADAPPP